MKALKETKDKAKAIGIEKYWLKSEEKLQIEIAELEAVSDTEAERPITEDSAETEVVDVKVIEPEVKEVKKEDGCPVDLATLELSIRGAGNKSPYWQWKDLLNA